MSPSTTRSFGRPPFGTESSDPSSTGQSSTGLSGATTSGAKKSGAKKSGPKRSDKDQKRNRAVTSEGYVRVRPTWKGRRFQQMNGAGFGRILGWLLGAFTGVLIMLAISHDLNPFVLILGVAVSSGLGCVIGHVVSSRVWRHVRPEIDAINPREIRVADLHPGQWMMMINDGTERAIRVEGSPQRAADPRAAVSDQPADTVAIPMSTGRSIIVPADLLVTVIDLASPVDS